MIFVGVDWAETHQDVCVLDPDGELLATRRITEGIEGVARLHALLKEHVGLARAIGAAYSGMEQRRARDEHKGDDSASLSHYDDYCRLLSGLYDAVGAAAEPSSRA